jgi:hypothetical protein
MDEVFDARERDSSTPWSNQQGSPRAFTEAGDRRIRSASIAAIAAELSGPFVSNSTRADSDGIRRSYPTVSVKVLV